MPVLRLAYATQFLIALVAMMLLWGQVGGTDHFDLTPWYLKLMLSAAAAFATVKATASAVSREPAWNGGTLKWIGILLAILLACGLTTVWVHRNMEDDNDGKDTSTASDRMRHAPPFPFHRPASGVRADFRAN